jgi:hypothetical protein
MTTTPTASMHRSHQKAVRESAHRRDWTKTDAALALELVAAGVTTKSVGTVTAVLCAKCADASIHAVAKATGINYRTAQRIVEAAAERRQGQLVAAS